MAGELSGWRRGIAAGAIGLLVGGGAVAGYHAWRGEAARGDMTQQVRAVLLEHPEILPEAMERLQARETSAAVRQHRAAIETPYHSAWAGAADGDVVLVEFFDYACGFCRASNPDIARLLREDPRLKVVWRELPVLGPDSEQAAINSLAAAEAGRFTAFHEALFSAARPSPEAIIQARGAVGLGPADLNEARRAEIQRNVDIARDLRASGTPTFVVGDRVLQGAVGYDALKAAIAAVRAGRRS